MAFRCQLCNKKRQYGHNVSHSKRRTKRVWLPNLQWKTIDGKRIRLCTKCIKRLKKNQSQDNLPETATK